MSSTNTRRHGARVAQRAGLRRAMTLLFGSMVLPGSAQFMVGHRRAGIIGMSLWVGLLTTFLLSYWVFRPERATVFSILTNPTVLYIGRLVFVLVLLGWLVALVDAWRLAVMPLVSLWRIALVSVGNLAVVSLAAATIFYGWNAISASRNVVQDVFDSTTTASPLEGRYNILLLGADSGDDRDGLRPDSLHIASIDASTGRTVLISLPRNLQNVPFSPDSPMYELYPYGFNCGSECLLNAVHTEASAYPELFPDSDDPGLDATIDAVEGATGLDISYHILINMAGFANLVDAVGGIEMDIAEPIAKFGRDDAWRDEYIPAGVHRLNGDEALWYARSRVQSDDYERMGRQKCLMQAMLSQLSPQNVVRRAGAIAESSTAMLSTDIPGSELGAFADLALKSRESAIPTLSIVPPEYATENPDFDQIHADISELIRLSEVGPTPAPPPPSVEATQDSSEQVEPTPSPTPTGGAAANNTEDLSSVC